jgi:radical SAM superfamily enzyme YgiQ (UPF0313 family)
MNKPKILLALLPFWDPFIPPMGIACLKSFLEKRGYLVSAVDLNIQRTLTESYDDYFATLREFIPEDLRSNFYNIGKDVLRNHMMAHIHYRDEDQYIELVKVIVLKTFFYEIDRQQAKNLKEILHVFFKRLEELFLDLLAKEKPDLLGISIFKGTLPASLYAFRLTRKHYPQIKNVMGGGIFADQLSLGSPDWEMFLKATPYIDKIFVGEGELLFLKYLQGELQDSQKIYTLEDNNRITLDIQQADIPDFSDFDLQYYPSLAAYTSRSCPFQCTFCSETVRWGKYRKKSAGQVLAEMGELNNQYGSRLFLMSDSLLNPIIDDLSLRLFDSALSLYWDGYLRVDADVCDSEKTLLWRRGGFYRARLGVESGSGRVLELMNKKITPQQIKAAVKNLADIGIKTTTYWIIGYPGETEEDFRQTVELIEELKDYIYEAEFNAFWYYATGQINSREWFKRSKFLYPESAAEMLIVQTRILDCLPSREETFDRLNRISGYSKQLGIPNPYTLLDIYKADERWKKLHKNAVPSMLTLKENGNDVAECKTVKKIIAAKDNQQITGDWGF